MSDPSHGTQGLNYKEPLIFERSSSQRRGYRLPSLTVPESKPSTCRTPAPLPEVSEMEVIRHFTKLSGWNYSIDQGPFPLGSCTMKYNPRINEEIALIPELAYAHPEMPPEMIQGSLALISQLEKILIEIAGMDAITLQPPAGALGEYTGLLLIRAYHRKKGSDREYIIIPDSAHGTNPASCSLAGYKTLAVKTSPEGFVPLSAITPLIEKYGEKIAGIMITNPNTLGLFEEDIEKIAHELHKIDAQVYMDGANMNAIVGVACPGHMGVDVMHYNLHKTFSTPHGGGGPGSGPVACKKHLAPFLPNPRVIQHEGTYQLEYQDDSIGKVKAHFGNYGMFIRALAYCLYHGHRDIRSIAQNAVLNANALKHELQGHVDIPFKKASYHEFVATDKDTQTTTLDISKSLIDRGYHPPTMYFPLTVKGCQLWEPTETENLKELKQLAETIKEVVKETREHQQTLPQKTIVKRVDEVKAARQPILTYQLPDKT